MADPKLVLSAENVTKELVRVGFQYDWLKEPNRFRLRIPKDFFAKIEANSTTNEDKLYTLTSYLLSTDPTPTWRRILSALDEVGNDQAVVKEMYKYAEPLTDPSFNIENLAPILELVENWQLICKDLKVPPDMTEKPELIKVLAEHIVERYNNASWIEISSRLFGFGEMKAVEATKKYLPASFQERNLEKSLTVDNMCHSLEKKKWSDIGKSIHIPEVKCEKIRKEFNDDPEKCSRAAWEFWIENHPAPSWERIAEGLFLIWEYELLRKIEKQYPSVISPVRRQIACQRAIKEKGLLHSITAHSVCCGFPRSGKSSFKERLVGRFHDSIDSTGVGEKPVRIEVVSTMLVDKETQKWIEIGSTEEEATLVADKVTLSMFDNKPNIGKGGKNLQGISQVRSPEISSSGTHASASESSPSIDPLRIIESASSDKPAQLNEFNTLVPTIKGITQPRNYGKTWTHYFSDVGGQLEFQELYPNLLSGPSLFHYTFKATQGLDEPYQVEYLHSGKSTIPYMACTTRESILQFLASIASIKKMNHWITNDESNVHSLSIMPMRPKVLFIATHVDKLAPGVDILEIDKELQKIVRGTQAFKDDMIVHWSESCMLFPIDNISRDNKAKEKIQNVKKVVNDVVTKNKEYHFDMPYTWALFSINVQNYPKQVIHYDTCREMGTKCGIDTDEDLNDCLWYLHHQTGILRYYGDVPALRHLIFKDTQYIFDGITNMITKTFTFENVTHILNSQEAFEKKGIFSLEKFKNICDNMSSYCDIVSSDVLIELFKHLRILAAYVKEETTADKKKCTGKKETKYFLPCALVHAKKSDMSKFSISCLPSLHFTFKIGFCPIGLFSALVADLLLSSETPSSSTGFEWSFEEEQIYHNQISFLVGPYGDQFQFTATPAFISVDVQEHPNAPRDHKFSLAEICYHVRTRLSLSLASMIEKLNYDTEKTKSSLGFQCPSQICNVADHSAFITLHQDEPCMLQCPYLPKNRLNLPHNYQIWFQKGIRFALIPGDCSIDENRRCGPNAQIDIVFIDINIPVGTTDPIRTYRGRADIVEFRVSFTVKCAPGYSGDKCQRCLGLECEHGVVRVAVIVGGVVSGVIILAICCACCACCCRHSKTRDTGDVIITAPPPHPAVIVVEATKVVEYELKDTGDVIITAPPPHPAVKVVEATKVDEYELKELVMSSSQLLPLILLPQ